MDKNVVDQLKAVIHHEVEHAMEHVVDSPIVINRVIGESMRHIGGIILQSSAAYLPVRPEEIRVQPQPLGGKNDLRAVVLVDRVISSKNAFHILAELKDGVVVSVVAFQPNEFQLSQTQVFTLVPEFLEEIKRQLRLLVKDSGFVYQQVLVFENYFGVTADPEVQEDPDPVPAVDVPAPVTPAVSKLPPIDDSRLM